MSGHSKWANIKRKKEANDKVKSNVFAKLSRAITVAVLEGGGPDVEHNIKLRLAVDKAKQENMPKESISRAIEKGSGPEKSSLVQLRFEAFGPAGSALLIEATTDNNNRTFSEVRNMIERHGGKLASHGSVAYLFNQSGVITFERVANKEEDVFEFAQRISATDFDEDDEHITVYFPFEQMGHVRDKVGILTGGSAEVIFRPSTIVQLNKHDSEKLMSLMEALENLEDVHSVHTNAEFMLE
jgi:YebC/PmpR family DNA-binding regulatory protein